MKNIFLNILLVLGMVVMMMEPCALALTEEENVEGIESSTFYSKILLGPPMPLLILNSEQQNPNNNADIDQSQDDAADAPTEEEENVKGIDSSASGSEQQNSPNNAEQSEQGSINDAITEDQVRNGINPVGKLDPSWPWVQALDAEIYGKNLTRTKIDFN